MRLLWELHLKLSQNALWGTTFFLPIKESFSPHVQDATFCTPNWQKSSSKKIVLLQKLGAQWDWQMCTPTTS